MPRIQLRVGPYSMPAPAVQPVWKLVALPDPTPGLTVPISDTLTFRLTPAKPRFPYNSQLSTAKPSRPVINIRKFGSLVERTSTIFFVVPFRVEPENFPSTPKTH